MRQAGPVVSIPSFRRAGAAVMGALLAIGGTVVAGPAAAAPPERTSVIVQLAPGSDAAAESRRAAAGGGGSVRHVYTDVFRGFAGEFTASALTGLRANPRVARIEVDGVARTHETQPSATWGLDRVDQRKLPLNGTFNFSLGASDVTAYVIDSGVAPHSDLDQVEAGFDAIAEGDGKNDCNGHGTHVAGTVAGNSYGVAKSATVVPVRVMNCDGSGKYMDIIAGLEWIIGHSSGPAVANMSLGGAASQSLDDAVTKLITHGVTVVVAAGNSNANACFSSPARVAGAITTGATDRTDKRASFSNHGSCLDLFAPGVNITSTWPGGATKTISGTSMASPHAAGAAAALLSKNPGATPVDVRDALVNSATAGLIKNAGSGSPNKILYAAP